MFENRMKFVLSAVVVLSLALAFAPSAFASNPTTTTFVVSTTVTNSCSVTATPLTFTYSETAAANAQSTVSVTCTTAGADFTVALNGGGANNVAARKMTNGTYNLGYQLYTTNAYSTVWGDGTGTSVTQSSASVTANTAVALTVYGQIPAGESAISGTYSDTITASVTY